MKILNALIRRNVKLFFKDKGMFFTSLITPLILLVLYVSFLGSVYEDSFLLSLPEGFSVPEDMLSGYVGGQLISSILAVSCVTVAFCSNMLMVQDKANGSIKDITVSPVKGSTLAIGYYIATFISTLIICFAATAVCLAYIAYTGWFMSLSDVLFLIADVILLAMFGTALSSVVNFFLSTQGQISAVGSIVSSGYGFVCGAYMPISQFSEVIQKVIYFLPGTYGTSLMRCHCLIGVCDEMRAFGLPGESIDALMDVVDCNLYWFERQVSMGEKYIILVGVIALLVGAYVFMNALKLKKVR